MSVPSGDETEQSAAELDLQIVDLETRTERKSINKCGGGCGGCGCSCGADAENRPHDI